MVKQNNVQNPVGMKMYLEESERIQWIAMLNNLQEEINNLKLGLSRVLSKEFSAALLVRMESFQTHLLNHDAAIAVLRHELALQLKNAATHIDAGSSSFPSDPANAIKVMAEEIEKLKVQLAKYTSAFVQ